MNKTRLNLCLPALLAMMSSVTSCIDNDYDLSDIDSTVRVEVNDLVVPIKLDKLTMSYLLDIKEGDQLQIIDGVYAVVEDGEFRSSDIRIDAFHFPAPVVRPTEVVISAQTANAARSLRAPGRLVFDLATPLEQVAYHASNVPSNIISFGKVGCSLGFSVRISVPQLAQLLGSVSLEGVKLQLPLGLEFSQVPDDDYSYNPSTGVFTFNQALATDARGTLDLRFAVSGIDAGIATDYHYDTHTLDFNGQVGIIGGQVTVDPSSISAGAIGSISSVSLRIDYQFSDIDVTSAGGVIQYDLDGFNVSDINLGNLPDVLTQDGTSIGIENPQVFLSLNNPLNDYGMYASTGISIIPIRDNQPGQAYGLDDGVFEIGRPHNSQGMYYYLLSPTTDGALSFPEFPDPVHEGYTNLRYVLEGNGIPQALRVNFDGAQLPVQEVTGLPLGQSLGHVEGKYKFVAPLQFTGGSTVIYSSKDTGWGSEDLDAMTIESLEINMDVISDLPVGLELTGYPIDANGNRINNVSIEGANIAATDGTQHVTLRITGSISKLDGIEYVARAYADNSDKALSPDMSIRLENIRPRVSGYYEKEL